MKLDTSLLSDSQNNMQREIQAQIIPGRCKRLWHCTGLPCCFPAHYKLQQVLNSPELGSGTEHRVFDCSGSVVYIPNETPTLCSIVTPPAIISAALKESDLTDESSPAVATDHNNTSLKQQTVGTRSSKPAGKVMKKSQKEITQQHTKFKERLNTAIRMADTLLNALAGQINVQVSATTVHSTQPVAASVHGTSDAPMNDTDSATQTHDTQQTESSSQASVTDNRHEFIMDLLHCGAQRYKEKVRLSQGKTATTSCLWDCFASQPPHVLPYELVYIKYNDRYVQALTAQKCDQDLYGKNYTDLNDLTNDMNKIKYALTSLHNKDIKHGDIKPENILIKDGRLLLTDFGFAREIPKPHCCSCSCCEPTPEIRCAGDFKYLYQHWIGASDIGQNQQQLLQEDRYGLAISGLRIAVCNNLIKGPLKSLLLKSNLDKYNELHTNFQEKLNKIEEILLLLQSSCIENSLYIDIFPFRQQEALEKLESLDDLINTMDNETSGHAGTIQGKETEKSSGYADTTAGAEPSSTQDSKKVKEQIDQTKKKIAELFGRYRVIRQNIEDKKEILIQEIIDSMETESEETNDIIDTQPRSAPNEESTGSNAAFFRLTKELLGSTQARRNSQQQTPSEAPLRDSMQRQVL